MKTAQHNTLKQNLVPFINIIEIARLKKVKKFIYASSSSVYGDSKIYPFNEQDYEKRLQKVFAVVDKLLAMSHEEHQDMLLDMFEVLSFNANVLRKYPLIKNIYDDLINLSIYGTKYFSE